MKVIGCCPPFSLSGPMRGEFCVLLSACPAPASSHVLQLLSAVTQWVAVPLPAPTLWAVNHRLQCSSQEISSKFALKLVSNRKLLKSCASIGCTKRQVSRVSFHIFPVGKVRQKQWLASLKLFWSMHLLYSPSLPLSPLTLFTPILAFLSCPLRGRYDVMVV